MFIGGQGLRTGGGDAAIEATGNVSASLRGVETGTSQIAGGKFTLSGKNFSAAAGRINTFGGDIILNHTGTVTIGSLSSAGGDFSMLSGTASLGGTGVMTDGGNFYFSGAELAINGGGYKPAAETWRSKLPVT